MSDLPRLLRVLLTEPPLTEVDRQRQGRVVFAIALALLACVPPYALFYLVSGPGLGPPTLVVLAAGLLVLPVFPSARRSHRVRLLGSYVVGILWVVLLVAGWFTGGLGSTTKIWLPAVPILALFLAGKRWTLAWTGMVLAHVLVLFALEHTGVQPPNLIEPAFQHAYLALSEVALALVLLVVGLSFEGAKSRALGEAEATRKQLAASEARFRTLIEHAPDPTVVYQRGGVVYANVAAARLPLELDAELFEGPVGEAHWRRQLRSSGPDGAPIVMELSATRVELDGEPAVIATARDVTERDQLAARAMAIDRMLSVGTLAASVGHEINNPLAYVMANLDHVSKHMPRIAERCRAREGCATAAAEGCPVAVPDACLALGEAIDDAREGAGRIRDIVRDLRSFSRAECDERATVHLPRVIETALNMTRAEIRHRARLHTEIGDLPPVVANEARIGQVLVNLLVNAAHAIPAGNAGKNAIQVRAYAEGAHVVIEVQDTGAGIPEPLREQIFEPFFTTKPREQGVGLGLSICRQTVLAHGGELTVESAVGSGTTFRMTLPAATPQDDRWGMRVPGAPG